MRSRWDRGTDRVVSGQHGYSQPAALDFFAAQKRAELAAMPGKLYRETIERARDLARSRPGSYLARHFESIYGEKL